MTVAIRDIETGLMDRMKKVLFVKVRLIFMFVVVVVISCCCYCFLAEL